MNKKVGWWIVFMLTILAILIYAFNPEEKIAGDDRLIPEDFVDEPAKGYVEYSNISWMWNDVNKAQEIAKQENKLILVDFWAKWCYWCIQMDKNAYSDEKVEEILVNNYVYIKIDADRYPEIAKFFGIAGLPTALILDQEGNILTRIPGYRSTEDLIEILENYLNGW